MQILLGYLDVSAIAQHQASSAGDTEPTFHATVTHHFLLTAQTFQLLEHRVREIADKMRELGLMPAKDFEETP